MEAVFLTSQMSPMQTEIWTITATNNIRFTLTGDGEIVGVDNGDQATVSKYQYTCPHRAITSANINAYAGKALVIVMFYKQSRKLYRKSRTPTV